MKIEVDEKKLEGLIKEDIARHLGWIDVIDMPEVTMSFDMETASFTVTLSVDGIKPESFELLLSEAVMSVKDFFVGSGRVSQVLELIARNPGLEKEFSKTDATERRHSIADSIKSLAKEVRAFRTDFPNLKYENEHELFEQINDFVFDIDKRDHVYQPSHRQPIPDDDIPF